MDAVKVQLTPTRSTSSNLNGSNSLAKKWYLTCSSDEVKRKGGYTQYNENFGRIGKYIQASEIGRFHFYCAACEADFSLAKMGPRAVERHVQSTRHKKIVAALATNPQDICNSDALTSFVTSEGPMASSSSRNMYSDMDLGSSIDIFDVRQREAMSDVCAPLQSVLQNTQVASNDATQSDCSSSFYSVTPKEEMVAICGGTANIISGSEADLNLDVKKELLSAETIQENNATGSEGAEKDSSGEVLGPPEPMSYSSVDSQIAATAIESLNRLANANVASASFLTNCSNRVGSGEKEQQLFVLKAEVLQLKKRMMRLKCEYYRKKIALVDYMKQNNMC